MPLEKGIGPSLVDNLLSFSGREQQVDLLRDAGLFNAVGLDLLLGVADETLNDEPGKARRLAELCADLANAADAPAAVPRADYVRAGAHHLNGEFHEDLRLTKAAYDGYVALGMNIEALRTNVGRMASLLELGRYQEALGVGEITSDTLGGKGELKVSPTQQEVGLLTALVQQNRAGCLEYMGRYEEALDAYAVAEERYRILGEPERLGEVLDNQGNVLSYLGRGNEALASHQAAAAIFEETGLSLSYAMSLSNIGETHLQLANYMSSLDAFQRARRSLESSDARAVEYFLMRNTADAYLALNLYSEALASYQEADGLLQEIGMEHDHARALWGMGSALMARSELEAAENALKEAARLFAVADNVPMLSGVMLEQASLLDALGDRKSALAEAHRALELVPEDTWPVHHVYARLRVADLLLPNSEAAEPHLLAARPLADRLALPQLRYRLNERLGRLRRLQGHHKEAQALLEAAIDEIELSRGTVAQDAMRVSFLRDKTAAYEDLLLVHLSGDDVGSAHRAFAVAERAKSRALVDLLTGDVGEGIPGFADPEAEGRIRTLQTDLNAVYGELLKGTGDARHRRRPSSGLHARAIELEREISRLWLQAVPDSRASDPFAPSAPPDGVGEDPPFDAVLLAYHVVGDEILAFVKDGDSIRVVRGLGTVAKTQRLLRKLELQWERCRVGPGFAERHTATLERSARQVLSALYDELVAPLEALLREAACVRCGSHAFREIAVVPHGILHRVPFHALFDGKQYLIERFEFSYAPSATVYALCQNREARGRNGAAVFGVDDPLIPAAMVEARAVAERLPGSEMHLGKDATISILRDRASEHRALHLACHGLFRADNPIFSALKLHDGWLTAADAMSLDLSGALITLSACESGRSEVIEGDEVLGLIRAFLGAGAGTLVVSLWLVQDETTAGLMSGWYERLRDGEGRAAALRAAQLELKERNPHPYYWAPFVLIGKR